MMIAKTKSFVEWYKPRLTRQNMPIIQEGTRLVDMTGGVNLKNILVVSMERVNTSWVNLTIYLIDNHKIVIDKYRFWDVSKLSLDKITQEEATALLL